MEIFSARDRKRASDRTEYRVTWCRECDLGRLVGDFLPQDAVKFFDIPYYTHSPAKVADGERTLLDRAITHLAWRSDKSLDFIPSELGQAGGRSVCDIGCGNGDQLMRFRDAGFVAVGIEPDPAARAIARSFGTVFDGTVEALPQQVMRQRFDVVLLSHVLDACCDFKAALANLSSILGPDGIAIIEVPNCASKGFRHYGAEWPWVDIPRHQTFFTEKSLRQAIKISGLIVQKIIYLGYTRQFSPQWRSRHRPAPLWLGRTIFAPTASKYDSIRVYATRDNRTR